MPEVSEQGKGVFSRMMSLFRGDGQADSIGENSSSSELLSGIYKFLVQKETQKQLEYQEYEKSKKQEEIELEKRHKEILKALTVRRPVKKKIEAKEKETKKEKPTEKEQKVEQKAETKQETTPQKTETPAPEPKKTTKRTAEPVTEKKPVVAPEPVTPPPILAETATKVITGAVAAASASSVLAKIKKHESFVGTAYHDPKKDKDGKIIENRYSIGYGHQITPAEIKNGYILVGDKKIPIVGELGKDTKISKEDADKLVEQDYKPYENAARKIPNFEKLTPEAQGALIDMTYNMGTAWYHDGKGNPRWPNLDRSLKNLDMESAAKSIMDSKYYKDTGKRAKENVELIRKGVSRSQQIPPSEISLNTGKNINDFSAENKDNKKYLMEQSTTPQTVTNNISLNQPPEEQNKKGKVDDRSAFDRKRTE